MNNIITASLTKTYVARHIATRYWKDTTTQSADLSKALATAAFKHVDVLKGLNPNRVYKFKVALHWSNGTKIGEPVGEPCSFIYHKGVMSSVYGSIATVVIRR
jgi:hypothetical protein